MTLRRDPGTGFFGPLGTSDIQGLDDALADKADATATTAALATKAATADLASTDRTKGAALVGIRGGGNLGDYIAGVSVDAFGAVGDGVTDDSAAFQAAIAWLVANLGGGVVHLGEKTYAISNVDVPGNVHIKGAGIGATAIKNAIADEPAFQSLGIVGAATHAGFANMGFSHFTYAGNVTGNFYEATGISALRMDSIFAYGGKTFIVSLTEAWDCFYINCFFGGGLADPVNDAIFVFDYGTTDNTNNQRFLNCHWETTTNRFIRSTGGPSSSNKNNKFYFVNCKFESHHKDTVQFTWSDTTMVSFTQTKFNLERTDTATVKCLMEFDNCLKFAWHSCIIDYTGSGAYEHPFFRIHTRDSYLFAFDATHGYGNAPPPPILVDAGIVLRGCDVYGGSSLKDDPRASWISSTGTISRMNVAADYLGVSSTARNPQVTLERTDATSGRSAWSIQVGVNGTLEFYRGSTRVGQFNAGDEFQPLAGINLGGSYAASTTNFPFIGTLRLHHGSDGALRTVLNANPTSGTSGKAVARFDVTTIPTSATAGVPGDMRISGTTLYIYTGDGTTHSWKSFAGATVA